MDKKSDPYERFWLWVDKSAGPDACWPWMGGQHTDGYGHFRVGAKVVTVHRLAYELATGQELGALHALHTCDNRLCCNPAHIYPGSNADNAQDRAVAGHPVGRKLTMDDVGHLRRLYASGQTMAEVTRAAAVFAHGKINRKSIFRMLRHETYKD